MEDRIIITGEDFLGMNTRVSEALLPPNMSTDVLNVEFTSRGFAVRPGFDALNTTTTGTNPITSIFQGWHAKFITAGTGVYYLDGSNNPSLIDNTLTNNAIPVWATYNGIDMMVNGSANNNPKSHNGVAWGDLAGSPPKADDIEVWRNRVYLTGLAYPYQGEIRYSGLEDPTIWESGGFLRPTKSELFANPICSKTVPFPQEEDGTRLAVFAEDRIYHIDGTGPTTWQLYTVQKGIGTLGRRCHVNAEGIHYWLSHDGFMASPDGGYTLNNISWPIQSNVDAIDRTTPARYQAAHNRARRQIWWAVTVDSDPGFNNRLYVYHYGLSTPMTPPQAEGARHIWSIWYTRGGDAGFNSLEELLLNGEYLIYMGEGNATLNGGYLYQFDSGDGSDNGYDKAWFYSMPFLVPSKSRSRDFVFRKFNFEYYAEDTAPEVIVGYNVNTGDVIPSNYTTLTLTAAANARRVASVYYNQRVAQLQMTLGGTVAANQNLRCLRFNVEMNPLRGTK